MKIIKINEFEKGLVFKNGGYKKIIEQGKHLLMPFEEVFIFNMADAFTPPCNINILLKDEEFVKNILLVEIKNNEIALKFENDLFNKILTPGRYIFWKGLIDYKFTIVDLNNIEIDKNIEKSILSKGELISFMRVFNLESYEKGLLFINGKFEKIVEAGIYYFWKNQTPIVILKADLRILQLEISGQEILTKDKAALRINFYAQYYVVDINKALVETKDFEKQLYILLQLALREIVGTLTFDELLDKKENISNSILLNVNNKANELGVDLKNCGIRDVILPGDVKDIMNQVLVAEKKAQANIIMRREETASTRSLLNTAKLMEENAMLFKLKEMEYVEKIAEKINNISLSGGNQLIDQLKDIFVPIKK